MKDYGPDIEKANTLMKSGALDEAEKILRAVTAAAPRDATAWHVLGRTYYLQNNLELAETCFRQRLVLDSEKAIANYSLAFVLEKLKRNDEAKFYVHHALQIDPTFKLAVTLQQQLAFAEQTKAKQDFSAVHPMKDVARSIPLDVSQSQSANPPLSPGPEKLSNELQHGKVEPGQLLFEGKPMLRSAVIPWLLLFMGLFAFYLVIMLMTGALR